MFHQKKMLGKELKKIILELLLMFCILKKEKYISNREKQVILFKIPKKNDTMLSLKEDEDLAV